ncbi:MAG: ISAs1 family transposase [Chitinophagales bacterium]
MQRQNHPIISFYEALQIELLDNRDNRGKKHCLNFVVLGVIIGILIGRITVSSIHRFLDIQFDWLCEITCFPADTVISRAQLPRLLLVVDWKIVNKLTIHYFGLKAINLLDNEWFAVDGKELRGCLQTLITGHKEKRAVSLLNAISHRDRKQIGAAYYEGDKESEIPCVRNFLTDNSLSDKSISLDALHCNPTTTALIAKAGGRYLISVKGNQQEMLTDFTQLHQRTKATFELDLTFEKHHGRIEERTTYVYNVEKEYFDKRWKESDIATLVVTERHFESLKTGKISKANAFHITNQKLESQQELISKELAIAVRGHWQVENDNQVRDVTFKEDELKVKNRDLAKVLASIWTSATAIIKKANPLNYKRQLEFFQLKPDKLIEFLRDIHFL